MKKLFGQFKKFISRGNVIDLAVGIIIGSAFTAIVNSVVNDIFMPIFSLLTGSVNFTDWKVQLSHGDKPITVNFGSFISALLNFIIVTIVVFLIVKAFNKLKDFKKSVFDEQKPLTEKECLFCKKKIHIDATRCPYCTSVVEAPKEPATNEYL